MDAKMEKLCERLVKWYPEHKVYAMDYLDKVLSKDITAYAVNHGKTVEQLLDSMGFEIISGQAVYELRHSQLTRPGHEPAIFRTKIAGMLSCLIKYYPDKKIPGSIQYDYKTLAEKITGAYQWLGYKSLENFLAAYGFEYSDSQAGETIVTCSEEGTIEREMRLVVDDTTKVGRTKTVFEDEIVEELKKRVGNTPYPGMNELKEANPDLIGNLKILANKSNEKFGMPLAMYFKTQGIISDAKKRVESTSATSQVTGKNIKKSATVSVTADGAMTDRVDKGLYTAVTVDEHKEENVMHIEEETTEREMRRFEDSSLVETKLNMDIDTERALLLRSLLLIRKKKIVDHERNAIAMYPPFAEFYSVNATIIPKGKKWGFELQRGGMENELGNYDLHGRLSYLLHDDGILLKCKSVEEVSKFLHEAIYDSDCRLSRSQKKDGEMFIKETSQGIKNVSDIEIIRVERRWDYEDWDGILMIKQDDELVKLAQKAWNTQGSEHITALDSFLEYLRNTGKKVVINDIGNGTYRRCDLHYTIRGGEAKVEKLVEDICNGRYCEPSFMKEIYEINLSTGIDREDAYYELF